MKLDLAIAETHAAERELGEELLRLGERHRADHDVYHLGRTLSAFCDEHVAALAEQGERHGASLDARPAQDGPRPLEAAREKGAELMGRRPEPALLLLRDLRELHLLACRASISWTILGQGAQAARDGDLLDVVARCHPRTLRTLRWTTTKIKESAPQVLTS